MAEAAYREMWEKLNMDMEAHDGLLAVLGKFYGDIYMSQEGRLKGMEYLDFVLSEVHGMRIKELQDAKAEGRKIVGTFCVFVPEELTLAADAIQVGLCAGADAGKEDAEKLVPRNTCALIKSFIGFKLAWICPFTESCDMECHLSISMMESGYPLATVTRFGIFPLHIFHFFNNLTGSQMFIPDLKFMRVSDFGYHTETCVFRRFYNFLNTVCTVRKNFSFFNTASAALTCRFQSGNFIRCSIIPGTVTRTGLRNPKNCGKGKNRVTGDCSDKNIIVSGDVTLRCMVIQFMYKFHIVAEFFRFCVINNNPDPPAAFFSFTGKIGFSEQFDKNRNARQVKQSFRRFRMPVQNNIKFFQF